MKMYKYFVSCNINANNVAGFSNHEIVRTIPITSISDIKEISTMLESEMNLPKGSVCILYYQLFNS